MGDLGYFDGKGRLWMCGRKSHRVVLENETLFTIPCERIFDTHPHVKRSALVRAENNGKPIAVLCIELKPNIRTDDHDRIRAELLETASKNPLTVHIRTVLFHKSFPMDIRHNAKIFREKLSDWVQDSIHTGIST